MSTCDSDDGIMSWFTFFLCGALLIIAIGTWDKVAQMHKEILALRHHIAGPPTAGHNHP